MTLTVAAEIHSACTAIILLQELSQPILKMHTGSSLSRKIRSTSSVASAANGRYLIARLLSDESAGLITPDSSQDDIGRDVQNCSLRRQIGSRRGEFCWAAGRKLFQSRSASICGCSRYSPAGAHAPRSGGAAMRCMTCDSLNRDFSLNASFKARACHRGRSEFCGSRRHRTAGWAPFYWW
jgi:hypothetical protein